MTEQITTKLNTEVQIIKSELANMKETSIESKLQNTAEHVDIVKRLDSFCVKLDSAIINKADRSEVTEAQKKIDGINAGLLAQARGSVVQTVGIIVTACGVIISLILAIKK